MSLYCLSPIGRRSDLYYPLLLGIISPFTSVPDKSAAPPLPSQARLDRALEITPNSIRTISRVPHAMDLFQSPSSNSSPEASQRDDTDRTILGTPDFCQLSSSTPQSPCAFIESWLNNYLHPSASPEIGDSTLLSPSLGFTEENNNSENCTFINPLLLHPYPL